MAELAVAEAAAKGGPAVAAAARRRRRAGPLLLMLAARALWALLRRHALRGRLQWGPPRALAEGQRRPFVAFSGSGLLLAYYHGVAIYLRDHFCLDNLRLSCVSGGCTTILGLALGIDPYKLMVTGLHAKKDMLANGLGGAYMLDFHTWHEKTIRYLVAMGITDDMVAALAEKGTCYIGVSRCFPVPRHHCVAMPPTVREAAALILCSMSTVPFFRTPGVFQGKFCVDGGCTAAWSVPEDQAWSEVIKVCPVPWYVSLPCPPFLGVAEIQPKRLMVADAVVLRSWAHYRGLIRTGYADAGQSHALLVSRGLRPLPSAPATPWEEWERLFESIDEDNLPPLGSERPAAASPRGPHGST